MVELPALELGRIDALLRPHQLQLVAAPLDNLRPRLGADADPVDSRRRRKRSVGFDGNAESAAMQRVDKLAVELEHRLAPRDHDQALLVLVTPKRLDAARKLVGAGELAAPVAVGADKIGIAKAAPRAGAVLLAAGPQIAPGEAQKHCSAARLQALALQREEAFLDGVGHA